MFELGLLIATGAGVYLFSLRHAMKNAKARVKNISLDFKAIRSIRPAYSALVFKVVVLIDNQSAFSGKADLLQIMCLINGKKISVKNQSPSLVFSAFQKSEISFLVAIPFKEVFPLFLNIREAIEANKILTIEVKGNIKSAAGVLSFYSKSKINLLN